MTRAAISMLSLVLLAAATCGPPVETPQACDLSPDADGDGARSTACGGTDCDDTDRTRFPGNVEVCDLANHDEDCDPTTFGVRDEDGDGYVDARCENFSETGGRAGGDDCDDTRADVHPNLPEVCDGRDNNCDGDIDDGVSATLYVDADGDGYGDAIAAPESGCFLRPGTSFTGTDCDDTRADKHPGLAEVCDGVDNDCDGEPDDGVLRAFYVDEDADGFGTDEEVLACAEAPGLAVRSGDCDDTNAALVNGSMRCVDALQIQVCRDGAWGAPTGCTSQQCFTQPNGSGNCR